MPHAPLTGACELSARSGSCGTAPREEDVVDLNADLGQARARLVELLPILEELNRSPTGRAIDQACAAVSATAVALAGAGAGPAPPQPERAQAPAFVRAGRHWQIRLVGRTALVEHSVGMLHLAVVLANPRREIAATELAVGAAAIGRRGHTDRRLAQPVLDRMAIQQYRRRLAELDADDPTTLTTQGGSQRTTHARTERAWLIAELAAATGLGARRRDFPDNAERARIAVSKAIRRAIDRIDAADPHIGGHLRGAVYTGARCAYWPPEG